MADPISGDNSGATATANPSSGPAATATATTQPGGQVNGQAAPAGESLGGIDPTRLPPELRKSYDDMLRDYRSKTEKVSETVKSEVAKAVEAYKQKAEWYDSATKDEKLVSMINDYVKQLQQPQDGNQSDLVQQKLAQIEIKLKTAETLEVINAFADAKNEKGELLHPDFDKLSGFKLGKHTQSGEYDILRAAIELAPGNTPQEKMDNGYKAAKATYDAIFEEGKKAGMGRLQTKAKSGTLAPSGASSAQSTAPGRPKNALEALQFARQGLAPNAG